MSGMIRLRMGSGDTILPQARSSRQLRPVVKGPQTARARLFRRAGNALRSLVFELLCRVRLARPRLPVASQSKLEPIHVPRGNAPLYLGADNGMPFVLTEPRLKELQFAAARELLAWLGIRWIPSRFYSILAQEADPGHAIDSFARQLGCDPRAVRRRDPPALARLRSMALLLHQLETDRSPHTESQRSRLESLLFFGNYDRVEELTRVYSQLNEAQAAYRSAGDIPIARIAQKAAVAEARRSQADERDEDDALQAHDAAQADVEDAERYRQAMERLQQLALVMAKLQLVEGAGKDPPAGWLWRTEEIRARLAVDVEADTHSLVGEYASAVEMLNRWSVERSRSYGTGRPGRGSSSRSRRMPKAREVLKLPRAGIIDRAAIEEAFNHLAAALSPRAGSSDLGASAARLREALHCRQLLLDDLASRAAS